MFVIGKRDMEAVQLASASMARAISEQSRAVGIAEILQSIKSGALIVAFRSTKALIVAEYS